MSALKRSIAAHVWRFPQLAVDSQIEQGKLTHSTFHLEAHSERPDVLDPERCLLTDDLALVPRLARMSVEIECHDGLHQVEGHPECSSEIGAVASDDNGLP
jgi:hypothetical protein